MEKNFMSSLDREENEPFSIGRRKSSTGSPGVTADLNDYYYLLTPWSRVLLEKLASLQLVKKFPAFYGTRRFLTTLTSTRHLSLSSASPIQSSYPNPTS